MSNELNAEQVRRASALLESYGVRERSDAALKFAWHATELVDLHDALHVKYDELRATYESTCDMLGYDGGEFDQ